MAIYHTHVVELWLACWRQPCELGRRVCFLSSILVSFADGNFERTIAAVLTDQHAVNCV